MKESYQTITSEDLWFILNNPWYISKLEWRLGDENNRKSMYDYLVELLELADQDGYFKIWKTSEGEPISLLGCYKMEDKNYTTFLISSSHYEEYAMKLSFEMRSILKEKASQHKGYTLGIYSTSQHPHLFTWLRFLGFRHHTEGDVGDRRYFKLVTPS